MNKKNGAAPTNGAGAQIVSNCFAFFLSGNVTDYHETHKLNSFFFI